MKKIVLALGVIAMMGAFCSCKKTCTCSWSLGGITQTTEYNMKDFNVKKCSDIPQIAVGGTGFTCK